MRVEAGLPHLSSGVIDAAERAESLGYDGVVSFETSHEPFLPLVLAAEHTQRVSLRTGLAISFPRSPMVVANVAWDLQGYSGGRFQLGLGTQVKGHNERRFSVPWSPPAPRMREYVLALRAIWDNWATGAPLRFTGDHYTFTLMTPNFTPERIANPNIPVYISALGPAMARVAGEVCDGLLVHPMCSYKYITEIILPAVEQGAKRAGRKLADVELLWGGFSATGDTDEELREAKNRIARSISFYGSTRTYADALAIHGWTTLNAQLHELSLAGKWNDMANLVTDEMVETLAETGTQEDVAAKINRRYGPICSAVMWSPRAADDDIRTRNLIKILHSA